MDRTMLAVGGGVLLIGGLAYYFLQKTAPSPRCASYTSQDDCHAHGCYWYDGSCHSTPSEVVPCTVGVDGFCTYEGRQICDSFNNLCMCTNPATKQWQCLEQDAYACRHSPPLTFKKCVAIDGEASCKINVGDSEDECNLGYATPCPCGAGVICPSLSWCEPTKNVCIKKAAESLWLNESNMDCIDHDSSHTCTYYFDEPVAANSIQGRLYYKWGPLPFGPVAYRIAAIYGNTEIVLDEDQLEWMPDWGDWTINKIFSTKGIEALEFNVSSPFTNIHVDKFIGQLSYVG